MFSTVTTIHPVCAGVGRWRRGELLLTVASDSHLLDSSWRRASSSSSCENAAILSGVGRAKEQELDGKWWWWLRRLG